MIVRTRAVYLSAILASLALAGCGEDTKKMLGLGKNPPDEFQVVGRAPLSIPPDFQLRPPAPGAARPQEATPATAARSAVLGGGAPANGTSGAPTGSAPVPRTTGNPQTASVTPVNDPPAPSSAPRTPVAAGAIGSTPPPTLVSAYTSGVLGRTTATAAKPPAVASAGAPGSAGAAATPSSGEQLLLSRLGADKALPNIRSVLTEELTKLADADETTINKLLWWRKPEAPAKILDANKESQRLQENAALGKPVTDGETPSIKRVGKSIFEGWF